MSDAVGEPSEDVVPLSRRDRARAQTVEEIKQTARRVLVEQGADGLALRAVAREMGMTAPALYRYFASREDLIEHVVADLYDELCQVIEAERDAVRPRTTGRRLLAACRAFRTWATRHHLEFGLLFGSPAARVGVPVGHGEPPKQGPAHEAGQRFGGIFAALLAQLYFERPFPIPAEEEITPELQEQLRAWCEQLPVPLPLGLTYVFLSCWIRLYGTVCMEIFGHLRFALDDAEPMFEAELAQIAARIGIEDEYAPPGRDAAHR